MACGVFRPGTEMKPLCPWDFVQPSPAQSPTNYLPAQNNAVKTSNTGPRLSLNSESNQTSRWIILHILILADHTGQLLQCPHLKVALPGAHAAGHFLVLEMKAHSSRRCGYPPPVLNQLQLSSCSKYWSLKFQELTKNLVCERRAGPHQHE